MHTRHDTPVGVMLGARDDRELRHTRVTREWRSEILLYVIQAVIKIVAQVVTTSLSIHDHSIDTVELGDIGYRINLLGPLAHTQQIYLALI